MSRSLEVGILCVMSGHSKWSTIKRKKEATDAARGKLFSKLVKQISIAARTSGGPNPDSNAKLRVAVDAARAANMPKENIDRAISKASEAADSLEEVMYEAYGPDGVGLMIATTTDNRNRTSAELKYILDRGGGSLGSPGSVAYNFAPKGYLLIKKAENVDEQTLALIDAGVEDVEESKLGIEAYTAPHELENVRRTIEKELGVEVYEVRLVQKPKTEQIVGDALGERIIKLVQALEEHDDVQDVFIAATLA